MSSEKNRERGSRSRLVSMCLFVPIVFAVVGAVMGGLRSSQEYRITTQLMLTPPDSFDMRHSTMTLPTFATVKSIFHSDNVLVTAYNNPRMKVHHKELVGAPGDWQVSELDLVDFSKPLRLPKKKSGRPTDGSRRAAGFEALAECVERSLQLTCDNCDEDGTALIVTMTFDHEDFDTSIAIVKSLADSLQCYFTKAGLTDRGKVIRSTQTAQDRIFRKRDALLSQRMNFVRDSPLVLTADGRALNPHREEKFRLMDVKQGLQEELMTQSRTSELISAIAEHSSDPVGALRVIRNIVGDAKPVEISQSDLASDQTADRDENEPDESKKEVDAVLSLFPEPISSELQLISFASHQRTQLIETQIEKASQKIMLEQAKELKLAKYEEQYVQLVGKIERVDSQIHGLEERLMKLDLMDEDAAIRVVELKAASREYVMVGDIWPRSIVGAIKGFTIGAILLWLILLVGAAMQDSTSRHASS